MVDLNSQTAIGGTGTGNIQLLKTMVDRPAIASLN
jgi:hypothetical protein